LYADILTCVTVPWIADAPELSPFAEWSAERHRFVQCHLFINQTLP